MELLSTLWGKDGRGERMRLIDADNLIPMIRYATIDSEVGIFPILIGFDAIKKVVDEAPTIDAEPVRHGHWIEYEPDNGIHFHKCSECGQGDMYQGTITDWNGRGFSFYYKRQYCPVCGAKMDEVEE